MKSNFIKYSILVAYLIFLGACSTKSSYKIKTFIFDGVPNPDELASAQTADSLVLGRDSSNVDLATILSPWKSSHPPYEKKECQACHNKDRMGKPKAELPELCFECHEDSQDQYEFLHGPMALGDCKSCHDPHRSKFQNLLVTKTDELCLDCHDGERILGQGIHVAINDQTCADCHHAHGGKDQYFLKDNTCLGCHQEIDLKKAFVHGPVAANQCSQCHEDHSSDSDMLLVLSGKDLCFNCHDDRDVYQSENHLANNNIDCITCHDPHAGDQKNFLSITDR